ncbi:hypothetical protein G7043_09780 [Lentzea sp. NEAU-D13]|uniref:Uncharacterized protein n=1 Tax=Lentzea alba TaxID=2714351 RepID=A0A7C9RNA0_9PSEU|nr:hypothetical protein [Lentzea alba]NGY59211.1 hypothetical protein [Lentzea alba]
MLEAVVQSYRKVMAWRVVGSYVIIVLATAVGARFIEVGLFASLAPSARDALSVMWQVHGAIISVGFTGLAITFQLLADPQVSPGPARRSVMRRIRFNQLLVVGIASDIATGMAAIWFHSHANVFLMFMLAFVPSILAIGVTYAYSAHLFGRPHEVEDLTLDDLIATIRDTARQLACYNEKASKLDEVVRKLPSIALGRNADPSSVPTLVVRVPEPVPPGLIQGFDTKKLEQISSLLVSAGAMKDIQSGESKSPVAYLRAHLGRKPLSGHGVIDVFNIDHLPDRVRDQLEKLAASALVVVDKADDPALLLLRALEDLQEVLIVAMQAARYPSVKRGFEHYRKIVVSVRSVMEGASGRLAVDSYETNWRWLDSHIWEINDIAARAGERVAIAATGAVYGRCVDALSSTDIGFFAAQAQNYSQLWSTLLLKADENENALEHLLVSLRDLTEYTVPYRVKHEEKIDSFAAAALGVWISILSEAYEKNKDQWATRALTYHSGLYRFTAKTSQMKSEVQQSAILLIAWLLYRRDTFGVDTGGAISQVLSSIKLDFSDMNSALRAAVGARRSENYDLIRRWEMTSAMPMYEARLVRASEFVFKAGILVLTKLPPLAPGSVPREFYDYSLAAGQYIEPLKSEIDPSWGIKEEYLDTVASALKLVIERYRGESQQRLKAAKLEEERVSKFLEALADEVRQSSRLLELVEPSEDQQVDSENSRVFGQRLSVPKLYFVETEVHGDPDHLGANVGRMIRVSEERLALIQLFSWGKSTSLSFVNSARKISRWAELASAPVVLLFGSYDVASLLNFNYDTSTIKVDGVTIEALQVYVLNDVEEHIALLDRAKLPRLVRRPEQGGSLKEIEGTQVSVSVVDKGDTDSDGVPSVEVEFGSLVQPVHPEITEVEFIRITDLPTEHFRVDDFAEDVPRS